jgi:formylglycine-generating enzyme required for sulfatase activity
MSQSTIIPAHIAYSYHYVFRRSALLICLMISGLLTNAQNKPFYCDTNMVLVKGGTFSMGSNTKRDKAKPVHTVTLPDFYIGRYEVTVCEFRMFIQASGYQTTAQKLGWGYVNSRKKRDGITWEFNATGYKRDPKQDFNPVTIVSWYDAVEYCNWLSKQTGKTYRLPSEAEWEYAAKGGSNSGNFEYSGSNIAKDVAWHRKDKRPADEPVATKRPNELGIYDMSGNVWEWCSDWYSKDYYRHSTSDTPSGPQQGRNRVMRGGAFNSAARICNPSYRNYDVPERRSGFCGFRIACAAS